MITSRRALLTTAAIAAGIPILSWVGLRRFRSTEHMIVEFLRKLLPGLAITDEVMLDFSAEYVRRRHSGSKATALIRNEIVTTGMALPVGLSQLAASAIPAYSWQTRDLMTTFLLSTDFFQDAGRNPQQTKFLAYSDPYSVGCRNKLGRFDVAVSRVEVDSSV